MMSAPAQQRRHDLLGAIALFVFAMLFVMIAVGSSKQCKCAGDQWFDGCSDLHHHQDLGIGTAAAPGLVAPLAQIITADTPAIPADLYTIPSAESHPTRTPLMVAPKTSPPRA